MEIITEDEVESEIHRIKGCTKNKINFPPNSMNANMLKSVKHLSQELDYLGLSTLSETLETCDDGKLIIMNLIYATKDLVHMYKTQTNDHSRKASENVKLTKECKDLDRIIERQKSEIENQIGRTQTLQERIKRVRMESAQYQKDSESIKQQLQTLKKQSDSKENQYKHTITRTLLEKEQLESSLRLNCDRYVSQDANVASVVNGYKDREAAYKSTIQKLHMNNEALMNEILNLKEDIVALIYEKNKT